MNYRLIKDKRLDVVVAVEIVGTTTSFPLVAQNSDYQEYLKWLAEGNEPLPADE